MDRRRQGASYNAKSAARPKAGDDRATPDFTSMFSSTMTRKSMPLHALTYFALSSRSRLQKADGHPGIQT